MRRSDFVDLVAIVDKLMVNLTDFNVLHFGTVPIETDREIECSRAKQFAQVQLINGLPTLTR